MNCTPLQLDIANHPWLHASGVYLTIYAIGLMTGGWLGSYVGFWLCRWNFKSGEVSR